MTMTPTAAPATTWSDDDHRAMARALELAAAAARAGEVPIGAVVVCSGQIVGAGHNGKEGGDPTAHAELLAIRAAAAARGDWRLSDCTLVSTVEPCLMCAGAILQARVGRVVYGCPDLKFGAVESQLEVFARPWNHRPVVARGLRADDAARLLKDFFAARRAGLDSRDPGA